MNTSTHTQHQLATALHWLNKPAHEIGAALDRIRDSRAVVESFTPTIQDLLLKRFENGTIRDWLELASYSSKTAIANALGDVETMKPEDVYAAIIREQNGPAANAARAIESELNQKHQKQLDEISQALLEFSAVANEYADGRDACEDYERAMEILRSIDPGGHANMHYRTETVELEVVATYYVEVPRTADGVDTDGMDAYDVENMGEETYREVRLPY